MKCLSIRQPWALLVCLGLRSIENRSWNTTYRGDVAIHAGNFNSAVRHYQSAGKLDDEMKAHISFGTIIGVVELCESVEFGQRDWNDPIAEGPFCLVFQSPKLFRTPIPYKGRVNLCSLPEKIEKLVAQGGTDCFDVTRDDLLERFRKAIPHGPIPSQFLPQPPRWHE